MSTSRLSDNSADLVEHFTVFGEAPDLVLVPHLLAIDVDVKHAAAALDERSLGAELLRNRLRQTGGTREVVSLRAVFDSDVHGAFCPFPNVKSTLFSMC